VAGTGFATLAATLPSINAVAVAGVVLLLGVDRFMNEAGAVTSLIGNGVATIAIAKCDGALNREQRSPGGFIAMAMPNQLNARRRDR
jgi:aerobic C4-dicarboxylate transport protein